MANINDFKLLNIKCAKYFELLEKEIGKELPVLSEKEKQRFGFYLLMLESICDIKDIGDILGLITDQEFNSTIFKTRDEDFGVDAIYIDEELGCINLFNFKYRQAFNSDKKQSLNDTFLSTKFTNAIISGNTKGINGKLKNKIDDIIRKLSSNEIWNMKLYVISNDNNVLDVNSNEITSLRSNYGLETITYGLNDIANQMSIRPNPINAILHLEKSSILPFVEDELSSSKSYVIRISVSELVRITCDDHQLRENYKLEDYKQLSEINMAFDLLFDNVRGLIVRSKFNKNILETLRDEPAKFFMYNNGLTITAEDIVSEDTNANKKIKITIKDFQVVNGGQTLRSIHNFNQLDKDNVTKYLAGCEVLLRIFKTKSGSNVRNKIAEYTNSQNAISLVDLKSLSSEQIEIEQYLDEYDIIYARKTGDTGITITKSYRHKISMEKFGQILFSIIGFPEKASNQKKQLFDKYYDQIFGKENFNISMSQKHIEKFYEIKNLYENSQKYDSSEQKIFFIIYLDQKIDATLESLIALLEEALESFNPNPDKPISATRKLIQIKFRNHLENIVKEKYD